MVYTREYIESVSISEEFTDKQKIAELLRVDASNHTSLGTESTQEERDIVNDISVKIYMAIMDIDLEMGEFFIKLMDQKNALD